MLINVVTGGDPVELAGDGLHLGRTLWFGIRLHVIVRETQRHSLNDFVTAVKSNQLASQELAQVN